MWACPRFIILPWQNCFTASARLRLPLRFVFVCIRLVVLTASFVGACTARPSFCNSYSFAEADDQWSPLPFPSYLLLLTCKRTLAFALRTTDEVFPNFAFCILHFAFLFASGIIASLRTPCVRLVLIVVLLHTEEKPTEGFATERNQGVEITKGAI